jgi:hypothetical protein
MKLDGVAMSYRPVSDVHCIGRRQSLVHGLPTSALRSFFHLRSFFRFFVPSSVRRLDVRKGSLSSVSSSWFFEFLLGRRWSSSIHEPAVTSKHLLESPELNSGFESSESFCFP